MSDSNRDIIGRLYGFNWAKREERDDGLAASGLVVADEIEARVSPEVDDRTLHGLQEFATFILGIEQDFSEFRYDAEQVSEPAPGQVVVTGYIRARGRLSKMPLTAPFGHLWEVRDGKAVKVEAHLSAEHAFAAVGGA